MASYTQAMGTLVCSLKVFFFGLKLKNQQNQFFFSVSKVHAKVEYRDEQTERFL
jgi:hypothetical protein